MVDQAYWQSTPVNSKMFEVAKILAYISMGFYSAEFVRTFTFDLSILTGKRQRRWPQLAYFGTKYIWITYMIQNLVVLWTETEIKCQIFFDLLEMQMGFVVILSSFLLACRTVCVYQGSARSTISIVLLIFGLGLSTAWMTGVLDVTASWQAEAASAWTTGGCVWTAVKPTYWVKYVVTIVFDLLVLVLTTIGILRMNGQSRIGDILIKHGLIYFILTFGANMVVTILTALQLSPTMSLVAAVPQSTVCVLCSTRLYIMLAEEARPQNGSGGVTSSQLSNSSGSKISSFLRSGGRKNADVIPFTSPTKSDFSSGNQTNSATGSMASTDDLEKAPDTPNQHGMIRVEQSRQVEVDPLPSHLMGTHPFGNSNGNNNMPAVNEDDELRHNQANLVSQYPRLLSRKQNNS